MTERQLDRLYGLVEELEQKGRADDAAAVKAAILVVEMAGREV